MSQQTRQTGGAEHSGDDRESGGRLLWRHCATGLVKTSVFRTILLVICLAQCTSAQENSETSRNSVDWADSTKQWIESTRRDTGSPPTDRLLVERAVESRAMRSDFAACRRILAEEHKANVSKQDLIELIQAKRDSIHDMRCKYRFEQEELDDHGEMVVIYWEESSFFRSGSKLRIHSTHTGDSPSETTDSEYCYNGSFVQFVDWSLNTPNASVNKLRGYSDFYRTHDVLANAMLLDCDVDLGMSRMRPFDLLEFLNAKSSFLLQELEEVDGRMCLVVTNATFRAYLDVDRDFSVMGFDTEIIVTDELGRVVGSQMRDKRRFEEMTDHGNGIWLPHKMETTFFLEDGTVWNRHKTEVLELAVNEGVDDSVFENIIPEGAFVFDSIRGASYRYGDDASIEGTLEGAVGTTAQNQARQFRWLLVIINVVAICAIGCWLFFRKRVRHEG